MKNEKIIEAITLQFQLPKKDITVIENAGLNDEGEGYALTKTPKTGDMTVRYDKKGVTSFEHCEGYEE